MDFERCFIMLANTLTEQECIDRNLFGELDQDKLPHLLELKYQGLADAVTALGSIANIKEAFIGFQRHL